MSRKKFFPLPRVRKVVTCIQPCLLLERLFVLPLWIAAHSSGDASPSGLSQLNGFMLLVAVDAIRFAKLRKPNVG